MAIKATTGIGKTRGIVDRLMNADLRSPLYIAPTHQVLEEIAEAFRSVVKQRPSTRKDLTCSPECIQSDGESFALMSDG